MSKWIHGVHDTDGSNLMSDEPGWIVVTEAIGCDPKDHTSRDYSQWSDKGFSILVRLNNGYSPAGTIPRPEQYDDFATRCANFVEASKGIYAVIIGNEPNHANERPHGLPIIPTQYAKCFNLCYMKIKNLRKSVLVLPAAVAPWDATTIYSGNSLGDWVIYYIDMLDSIYICDGITVHTYTHGADPALITDAKKMNPPFQDKFYNFRAYTDFLRATPTSLKHLPAFITETDQVEPWLDVNRGWVQRAYEEIAFWNSSRDLPKIYALCLYRSNADDQWSFKDKKGVQRDFMDAVEVGHQIPDGGFTPPIQPPVQPPNPGPTPPPSQDRYIDPDLIRRGVTFAFATPPKGVAYWKIVRAEWYDEEEADQAGPDHHIFGTVKQSGKQVAGVVFQVTWPSGSTEVISKNEQRLVNYNYDYPMSASLNEFTIWINDLVQSDSAAGIGMGKDGNPRIHTSTRIDWEWTISSGSEEPITPPIVIPPTPVPNVKLVHPLSGAWITQHFYQNPEDYARFGLIGHNGTDLGGKEQNTPVLSICDGVVAFSGTDVDYGNYVRVKHNQEDMICYTMYAHLSEPGLAEGVVVRAGAVIGKLGMTGNATGVHLHLEVRLMRRDGTYRDDTPMSKGRVDPESFFAERGLKIG